MDNPIFVVGLPRSGSTLFENIISMNPKVLLLGEVLFLTPWRKDFRYFLKKQVGDLRDERNIEKMLDLIFSDEYVPGITGSFWRFRHIDAGKNIGLRKELFLKIKSSDKSLESIFKIIIAETTRFSGLPRCCVAFPVYANHVPELMRWYPNCKIIQVTRDPRGIAISKTNDPTGAALMIKEYPHARFFIRKMMILFVIIQYIWVSKLHCKYKNLKNYALFRYEDLLVSPEEEIRKICAFAEIEFIPEMLNPRVDHPSSVTGEKQQGFKKKSASHWKKVITPFERMVVTLLTRRSMKRFDYDPKTHPIYFDD